MTAQNINKIADPMHLSSGQFLEFYNKKDLGKWVFITFGLKPF